MANFIVVFFYIFYHITDEQIFSDVWKISENFLSIMDFFITAKLRRARLNGYQPSCWFMKILLWIE